MVYDQSMSRRTYTLIYLCMYIVYAHTCSFTPINTCVRLRGYVWPRCLLHWLPGALMKFISRDTGNCWEILMNLFDLLGRKCGKCNPLRCTKLECEERARESVRDRCRISAAENYRLSIFPQNYYPLIFLN